MTKKVEPTAIPTIAQVPSEGWGLSVDDGVGVSGFVARRVLVFAGEALARGDGGVPSISLTESTYVQFAPTENCHSLSFVPRTPLVSFDEIQTS
jgi:hypothetical protein